LGAAFIDLKTQYRSSAALVAPWVKLFYNDDVASAFPDGPPAAQLSNTVGAFDGRLHEALRTKAVVCVGISDQEEDFGKVGTSRINYDECAKAIALLLDYAAQARALIQRGRRPLRIMVTSMHTAGVNLMKKVAYEALGRTDFFLTQFVEFLTVDGSQGREADLVFVLMVSKTTNRPIAKQDVPTGGNDSFGSLSVG